MLRTLRSGANGVVVAVGVLVALPIVVAAERVHAGAGERVARRRPSHQPVLRRPFRRRRRGRARPRWSVRVVAAGMTVADRKALRDRVERTVRDGSSRVAR